MSGGAANSDANFALTNAIGSSVTKVSRRDNCRRQVCEDFGDILRSKEFSDFKIKCGGQTFDCHKLVLATRSPVFKAMFESNMRETSLNEVKIRDVQPNTITQMLHFIYTGTLKNGHITEEGAYDLLGTANKYNLDLLKNLCEEKLCESLNIGNSVRYLVLSDMQQAYKLRGMSMEFVVKNMDLIVDTDVYKDLMDTHKDLVLEITKLLVEKAGTKRREVDQIHPVSPYSIVVPRSPSTSPPSSPHHLPML